MSRKSKITVAFPRGGIIPKNVLKVDEDRRCGPGEAVTVPIEYGLHLIEDKFAIEATSDQKTKGKQTPSELNRLSTADVDALKAEVSAAEELLEDASDDDAKSAAEKALQEAREKLAAAENN